MGLSWMAWTWQTAAFFGIIAALLALMTFLEIRRPGGNARDGILGLRTTRGDRLFISLLAAAYVHILWLFFFGMPLTWAFTGNELNSIESVADLFGARSDDYVAFGMNMTSLNFSLSRALATTWGLGDEVSGRTLAVIGMGSWLTFDVGNDTDELEQRTAVLREFFKHGIHYCSSLLF